MNQLSLSINLKRIPNNMNVFTKPEIADNYDAYYQTKDGRQVNKIEEELIAAALQKVPAGKMLELGCGTGHWTKFFIENGFKLTATDISDAMLKYARQKKLQAQILKADSEKLPFNDESFDVVSSITMMEFVMDKDKVLSEIYRVLKPNGYVFLGALNGKSQLAKNAGNDPVFKNANFFTPESLHERLSQFGIPEISFGVYFSPNFELQDGTTQQEKHEPAFMLGRVQKTK
jgi:ubiquinone/menaquinone biosynthesis C-methylase UbiE